MSEIYNPEQDSFLLSKVLEMQIPKLLKQNKDLTFLEIGCGSTIQLKTALDLGIKKQNIFSCDINSKAVNHCKKLGFNCVHSNLFENIKDAWYPAEAKKRCHPSVLRGRSARKIKGFPRFQNINGKYNLIVFNPPYLPEDKKEPKDSRLATTGGKKGSEIINEFLKQAKNYLKKNGKIFLLTSSLTKQINFSGYKKKLIKKEKLFFEELYVWKLAV